MSVCLLVYSASYIQVVLCLFHSLHTHSHPSYQFQNSSQIHCFKFMASQSFFSPSLQSFASELFAHNLFRCFSVFFTVTLCLSLLFSYLVFLDLVSDSLRLNVYRLTRFLHACVRACVRVCVCVCVCCGCVYVCVCCVCIYIYTHIHTYVHTHTHIILLSLFVPEFLFRSACSGTTLKQTITGLYTSPLQYTFSGVILVQFKSDSLTSYDGFTALWSTDNSAPAPALTPATPALSLVMPVCDTHVYVATI